MTETVKGSEWPTSALAAAEKAFQLLTIPPAPLMFDPRGLGHGLPEAPIRLDQLRTLLLCRSTSQRARDAVWHRLVDHARRWGPAWVVAAVGMALPALRRMAARLHAGYAHQADDIDAELLAGFLHGLRHGDLAGPAPYARLCWLGWEKARAARGDDPPVVVSQLPDSAASGTPLRPYGHPDLVLVRAVAAGYLTGEQAELISATRLGRQLVEQLAAEQGVTPGVLRMRRRRGELALADALRRGDLDSARPVPNPKQRRRRRPHTTGSCQPAA